MTINATLPSPSDEVSPPRTQVAPPRTQAPTSSTEEAAAAAAAASILQEELQQTRPFHSASQEAVLGLWRTTDIVRRQYMQLLKDYGVTLQQYNVLRILRGAGESGLPTLAIAERMVEHAPGITRLIDRLEKRDWVERHRPKGDRRRVLCRITEDGLDILRRTDEPVDALDDDCLNMLDEEEIAFLIRILDRVRREYPA